MLRKNEGLSVFSEETEVPALRQLQKADVIEYFDKYLAVNAVKRRKFCSLVYDNSTDEDDLKKKTRVKRTASGDGPVFFFLSNFN